MINKGIFIGDHFSKAVYIFEKCGNVQNISVSSTALMKGIHFDPYAETITYYVADHRAGASKVVTVGEVIKT